MTGLPAPSAIRTAKIATTEPGRVVRIAGKIDGKTAAAIRKQLVLIVG
jgi:anti-anti-sigma regulatory factor